MPDNVIRLLYIEDNPVDADLVRRTLAHDLPKARVSVAGTLAEGLRALEHDGAFDIVLADLSLPDGSGMELLGIVRGRGLGPAFVVLTGSGDESAAVAALKSGADDYLVKGADYLARLAGTIRFAIARAREEPLGHRRPIHVLYAEQYPFDAEMTLRKLAQSAPHLRFDLVRGTKAVIDRLSAGRDVASYDLLLLDYALPGMNALDLTKALRRDLGLDIPIVIVTGQGCEESVAQALRLGVSDYLIKREGYLNELPLVIDSAFRQAELVRERTALKAIAERLRLHSAVIESTHDGVLITDLEGAIVSVNQAFTELTGYTRDDSMGRNPRFLSSGRHDRGFYQTMWATLLQTGRWQGELWNRRKNGELYPEWLTLSAVCNEAGEVTNYVGVFTDISKLRQTEARLSHLSHYDPLTDLPNRLLVMSRLEHAIEVARRRRGHVAAICLDLDRFKTINDSLGHQAGDALLRAVGARLRTRLREEDTLGRLGGDEFMILLEHVDAPAAAALVAHNLIEGLTEPFVLDHGQEVFMHASIGISLYPDDADDHMALVRNADAAMYRAKQQGRNTYQFYTEDLTRFAFRRLDLETRFRRALGNGEFVVFYQPVLSMEAGHLLGAEALVRWQPPGEDMIAPADFIPIAEETGLIVQLGEWVLGEACRQVCRWDAAGLLLPSVSVNLSVEQVRRQDVGSMLLRVLAQTGLAPQRLEIELTESSLMQQGEKAAQLLDLLKHQGVRLAIDDFGTGYSSLAYLKRFAIDKLKIDRSFVKDLAKGSNDLAIASAIVAMAKALEIAVQAEGVETEAQLALLKSIGCGCWQGYACSPPVSASEFERRFLRAGLIASA
ncbi:EAL domain-containing protein [Azoarcus sp. L1K30]|uniref:EAL domain-containing protein n=1 Tax=Azoarcus sp. L1K30 TaxID=2820277 RepID=UPI001B82C635|nr:EAL domain-containing protein [Azoarcus sp. L1K30]MBR0568102.1 EAL domain-containing protein [Azoarcus sp. L1K30]